MPAVSRKQQRFFGMVRQAQKEGQAKAASPEVARVASSIKKSDAKDFASTKHKGLPEKKKMNEEGYDHLRDMGMIPPTKGKKDATTMPKSYKRSPEPKKGKSALDIVKGNIRKKYGKGAIMGEENLEEKKKGLWDNIHAKRKRGEKPAKKGDKDYPETLNVEDVNCDDRKKMVADHGALHKKKSDETGGLPRPVAAKNRVATKQGVDEEVITERQKDSDNQRLSLERGRSNYGKASIRNMRASGKGGNAADPAERLVAMDARHKAHKEKRGVKTKGMKEETALDKAKKNIGRDPDKKTCWKGYKAVGTKMKGGKSVPDCQKEGVMGMVKRAAGIKQKPAKKTTGRDAGAIAAKIMRDKEQRKYVGFLPANEEIDRPYTGPDKKDRAVIKKMDNKKFAAKLADYEKNMDPKKRQALKDKATKGMKFTHEAIKYDSKGSSMDYFLGADPKKTKEYKALKKKKTQKEGTSYGLYKGSGKPSGAMKKYLDRKAKMLQKKRDSQSDAAKNNPHFDSTVPSPSGRNKYEQVSFKDFINESSLSRIKSKSDKGGIAIMSASRGDKSKKENSARGKQLDKDIRGRFGRGATKVTGSYMEKGDDGKERKVKEKSHVIDRGKMGKRKFKKAVKKLGKKYGQDSVLTQTKKSATLSATRKGGLGKAKGVNVGKFKPQGKNPEGQSQIKGKTFTYG
jgi:hypothetical protein